MVCGAIKKIVTVLSTVTIFFTKLYLINFCNDYRVMFTSRDADYVEIFILILKFRLGKVYAFNILI